jgi:hypothetical protein
MKDRNPKKDGGGPEHGELVRHAHVEREEKRSQRGDQRGRLDSSRYGPELSYPLIFSRAKMQLEVGISRRRLSYDES